MRLVERFDQPQASDQGQPLSEYQTDQLRGVIPFSVRGPILDVRF